MGCLSLLLAAVGVMCCELVGRGVIRLHLVQLRCKGRCKASTTHSSVSCQLQHAAEVAQRNYLENCGSVLHSSGRWPGL